MTSALILVLLATSAVHARENKVIYGLDGRNEVYTYHDRDVVNVSRSTVALVPSNHVTELKNGGVRISGPGYGESYNLCRNERFYKQPSGAFCSGFLIAPNKIMTAGHCIRNEQACADVRFAFDYRMKSSSRVNDTLSANQVYKCKSILGWKEEDAGADFAIIELDRPVTGRRPLRLASNRALRRGTKLVVIGHPAGIPTKITDGAAVRTVNTAAGFFVANLDTYGGNSGSAVFNERTLEVEGILVRGEEDFRETPGGCIASYRIRNNEGRGEDVTLVSATSENGFTDPTLALIDLLDGLFDN